MSTIHKISLSLALTLACTLGAQVRNNSPYSIFGIGDLQSQTTIAQQSRGGLGAADQSTTQPNLQNPAGLGSLRFATFDVAGYLNFNSYKESGKTYNVKEGNFNYFQLAFPITRTWHVEGDTALRRTGIQWGMGISLSPFSNVAFDQRQDSVLRNGFDLIGSVAKRRSVSGNLSQLNWSNGISWKNFSFGVSLGYIFGKTQDQTATVFLEGPVSVNGWDLYDLSKTTYNALTYNLGAQYTYMLTKKGAKESDEDYQERFKTKLVLGAWGHGAWNLNETGSSVTIRQDVSGATSPDTLNDGGQYSATRTLPASFGVGATMMREYNYQMGVQFDMTDWSGFSRNTGQYWRTSIGGEWIPDANSNSNYLKRISYRVGGFYTQDYRLANDRFGSNKLYKLNQVAFTGGFGLPIVLKKFRGRPAMVNLGFEVGQSGNTDLISSNYVRGSIGFTFGDNSWFFRSKFR